jgi:DNA mismatch endonuclease (patch repair protein)
MTDIFSKEKRSEVMSHIRGKNTKIELKVRSYLHRRGFRFRVNDKRYKGTPDIVLPKYKTVIFINGCFWHNHGCKYSSVPKSNVEFWEEKFNRTKKRDEETINELRKDGWNVIVLWECEIQNDFEEKMFLVEEVINNKINE